MKFNTITPNFSILAPSFVLGAFMLVICEIIKMTVLRDHILGIKPMIGALDSMQFALGIFIFYALHLTNNKPAKLLILMMVLPMFFPIIHKDVIYLIIHGIITLCTIWACVLKNGTYLRDQDKVAEEELKTNTKSRFQEKLEDMAKERKNEKPNTESFD